MATFTALPEPADARVRLDLNWANLLDADQATIESTGTLAWVAEANTAVTRSTTQARTGVASLRLAATAGAVISAETFTATAVNASEQYTAAAYFRTAVTGRTMRVAFQWYTAAMATISVSNGSTITDTTSGWTRGTVTATAPATAAFAGVIVQSSVSVTNGELHYVDDVGMWEGAAVDVPLTSALISRTDPDGVTRTVRGADPVTLVAGVALIYDHEAPFNQAVVYEASSSQTPSVVELAPATLTSDRVWLKHPLLPSLNKSVVVMEKPTQVTYAARRTVHPILGRRDPIVVTDTRQTAESSVSFYTQDLVDAGALEDLIADGSILLLAGLPEWGIPHSYISVGDAQVEALGPLVTEHARKTTLPYITVDRPAGNVGGTAGATWADVTTVYATWTAVRNGETDWLDVIAGVS